MAVITSVVCHTQGEFFLTTTNLEEGGEAFPHKGK